MMLNKHNNKMTS